jgi:transposase InsO family protein
MPSQPLQFLLLLFAGWVNRKQLDVIDYLKEENRILREQMHGRRLRFTDEQRRRLAVRGKVLGRSRLRDVTILLTPDTILHWNRQLIADKYNGTGKRGPGRPRTAVPLREMLIRFAKENPAWGYTRLRGALRNLGHVIGRNTIKRILKDHGVQPAPERSKRMQWKTFLKAHSGVLAATDFFSVEVLTLAGLVRYYILFVIDIRTRRVQVAGIVHQPHGAWMKQVARNLTDGVDGFLKRTRYLIHDRDPLFTDEFRNILRAGGVECIKLPASSPDLNAYAERFVLSIKSECLNKLIPLGERHLRYVVSEFVEHYHLERNHQGLDNRLIVTPPDSGSNDNGPIARRERLGGLLNFYYRRAA